MTDSADSSQGKPVNSRKLLRAIDESFNIEDLDALCFDLQIDFENLEGTVKQHKIRSLIRHFANRRRLSVLVVAFLELRPHVDIEAIVLTEEDEDPTESHTDFYTTDTLPQQDKSNTMIASKSISAIVRMLARPDVREAAISFQTDFKAASQQIEQMNDYKQIHDLFQMLENQYYLISRDQKRLPDDDMAWDDIAIAEPELQTRVNDMIAISKSQTFAGSDVRWTSQLETVRERLHTAVEEEDVEALESGVRLLYRVLNRHPTRINAQLVAVAGALRLDNLEQAITTISTKLTETDVQLDHLVTEVQSGESALAGLDERLKELVREHNAWQSIDDEIRRVKSAVSQNNIDELEDAWYDLEPMTKSCTEPHSDQEWAMNLSKVMADLAPALEDQLISKVRRLFMRYHTYVGHRFREVDLELLSLCTELQRVGEQIDLLLRQFNK